MIKIGIIGMGHVGSDLAYTLCQKGQVSELVLIDKNESKVTAEILELEDAMVMTDTMIKITSQNYSALRDANVVVLSFGSQNIENEDRNSELADNVASVKEVVPKIVDSGFKGIFLVISNPCDVIASLVHDISGFPAQRVIGTGTSLDTNRMKRIVGRKLNVSSQNINGFVLGEHGESQFVAWSTVTVGNRLVTEHYGMTKAEQEEMKEATRLGGWDIHQRKGWTSYGIASTASRIIQSIIKNERALYPVSIFDGQEEIYLGYPAIIGRKGIEERFELNLTKTEAEKYQRSANKIKTLFQSVK